jgi:6-phosphogluconate dehydrogenase
MDLGFIGLGRMGGNMVRRLSKAGHRCHIYSSTPSARKDLSAETGAVAQYSVAAVVAALKPPRAIWLMVPAGGVTGQVLDELADLCGPGDVIVDGGNSHFKESVARAQALAARGILMVDCGTSGGVFGLTRGYSLMLGGTDAAIARIAPVLHTLAPGIDAAERTPAREGGPVAPGEVGWLHCGKAGSGHYVKMIHNGIEYGMMQAMAEGFALFASAKGDVVAEDYRYDLDLAAIAEVWRRGSVVSSWLLDLGADALAANPSLDLYSPEVADSGEGRWTIEAAIDQRTSAQVLAAALFARFDSRDSGQLGNRFLSALRNKFGGHPSLSAQG